MYWKTVALMAERSGGVVVGELDRMRRIAHADLMSRATLVEELETVKQKAESVFGSLQLVAEDLEFARKSTRALSYQNSELMAKLSELRQIHEQDLRKIDVLVQEVANQERVSEVLAVFYLMDKSCDWGVALFNEQAKEMKYNPEELQHVLREKFFAASMELVRTAFPPRK